MELNTHIFREYDIRGIVGKDLTPNVVKLLGLGIGTFFSNRGAKKITLGRDGRLSSPDIRKNLSKGLGRAGISIVDIGIVPSPLSYYSTHTMEVDGSVMITGSHNPADYNGFKVTLGTDSVYGDQIQEIRKIIESGNFSAGTVNNSKTDVIPDYLKDLGERLDITRKIRVGIDPGNGVGGLTAIPLLESLGCEVHAINTEVDGNFPAHHPDPTVVSNLEMLKELVRAEKLELGIAFDGDADRIGIVDENGDVLMGDQILAVLARNVLKDKPGATIIGEVKCSKLLFNDILKHGGDPVMWKVGHSLIKSKMHQTGAMLAGEVSGHIFFKHRFYGFDDASYVAARFLEIVDKSSEPVSRFLSDWPRTWNTPEIRRECPDEIKFAVVSAVCDYFKRKYEVIDVDGMRVNMPGGWGLLRASNTQPVVVMRFEADSENRLNEIRREIETVLNKEVTIRNEN